MLNLDRLPFSSSKNNYSHYRHKGFCNRNSCENSGGTKLKLNGQQIRQRNLKQPKTNKVNDRGGLGIAGSIEGLDDHHSISKKIYNQRRQS